MLALVTAAREHHSALTATGANLINSFDEGGLDFLWGEALQQAVLAAAHDDVERVEQDAALVGLLEELPFICPVIVAIGSLIMVVIKLCKDLAQ